MIIITVLFCNHKTKIVIIILFVQARVDFRKENDDSDDSDNGDEPMNEISYYLNGRYLCSMEAMWRIYGYQIYPATSPSVILLTIQLKDQVELFIKKGQCCNTLLYFKRPVQLLHCKYTELFRDYIITNNLPHHFTPNQENIDYFIIQIPRITYVMYYYLRNQQNKIHFARLKMLYPQYGDIFYLREILLCETPTSFEEAKTHNGFEYGTFQEAALAKGYIKDHEKLIRQFREIIPLATPAELRSLFSALLMDGYPMHAVYAQEDIKNALMSDFSLSENSTTTASNTFWKDISNRLQRCGGHELSFYGFDNPKDRLSELEREQEKYNCDAQHQLFLDLQSGQPLNPGQQAAFNAIDRRVEEFDANHRKSKFIFLSGPGGTGKTCLCIQLHAYFRSKGFLIRICASTSLAATLYKGAETAHSLFKVGVLDESEREEDDIAECSLYKTERLELLRNCRIIFWDEFVSNHREVFEAVVKQYEQEQIYCVFVCCGDFRQILPVKRGTPDDTIQACISSSHHWPEFEVFELTENMRISAMLKSSDVTEEQKNAEQEYAKTIEALAIGKESEECKIIDNNVISHIHVVQLLNINHIMSDNFEDGLRWLFPDNFSPHAAVDNCVLSATNKSGNIWNKRIQDMNPGQEIIYSSHDVLCEVDDPHNHIQNMAGEALLNTVSASGAPEHYLRLKINDICLVLRGLRPAGLATNERVRIIQFYSNCVKVETLQTPSRTIYIPKIRFKFPTNFNSSYKMIRTQFPLRLAYCMTYNKSQGQTLNRVLLDTTEEPFAHGHAYVAMSRVRTRKNICIFLHPHAIREGHPTLTNVVYDKIIQFANLVVPSY